MASVDSACLLAPGVKVCLATPRPLPWSCRCLVWPAPRSVLCIYDPRSWVRPLDFQQAVTLPTRAFNRGPVSRHLGHSTQACRQECTKEELLIFPPSGSISSCKHCTPPLQPNRPQMKQLKECNTILHHRQKHLAPELHLGTWPHHATVRQTLQHLLNAIHL